VETAQEGIAVVQDGKLAFANRQLTTMLDRPLDELKVLPSFAEVVEPGNIPTSPQYRVEESG
jgi:hypothetical protein